MLSPFLVTAARQVCCARAPLLPCRVPGGGAEGAPSATTSSGTAYAGIIIFSGTTITARNINLYGLSAVGSGLQIGYGGSAATQLNAATQISIYGRSSNSSPSGNYLSYGMFFNGATLTSPTIYLEGAGRLTGCTNAYSCAGVSIGWIGFLTPGTNNNTFNTNNFTIKYTYQLIFY